MTVGVLDMPQEESAPLLDKVFDQAEKPEFVYEHVWRWATCCCGTTAARRMRAPISPRPSAG